MKIKNGDKVYWNDPDNGFSSGEYTVVKSPESQYPDDIFLIHNEHGSEAEVPRFEIKKIT